jgi:hypothetical protein
MEGRSEERKQGVRKETKKKPGKGGNKIISKCVLKMLRHDD